MTYKNADYKIRQGVSLTNTETVGFSTMIDIVNETDRTLFWLDHNNNPFCAEPSRRTGPRSLVKVYISYVYERKADFITVINFIHRLNQIWQTRRKVNAVYEEIVKREKDTAIQETRCLIRLCVDIEAKDLVDGECVFEEISNLVFSHKNIFSLLHPGSVQARIEKLPEMNFNKNTMPQGLNFEIIDNDNPGAQRFIHMANTVVAVDVRRDFVKPQGLYVYRTTGEGDPSHAILSEFYGMGVNEGNGTIEQGCTLYGIYKTKEEAETNGNPEILLNLHLKEKEQGNRELKLEVERQKSIADENKIRYQQEVQELDRKNTAEKAAFERKILEDRTEFERKLAEEKAERENRLNREKDYYERKSADRKDVSELIKFIPAVLMGFIGAALLFRRA